jgi:CBS domain containing-hemolysin-like protein
MHIVVGELMPKSLAIRQAEKVSVWTAVPLYGFYWLMYPAIWLLNLCSNFLLEKTGLTNMSHGEHFYSTDELKLILSASHLHGELTQEEIEILEHTLDFTDLKVTEVMRSRKEMIFISLAQSINEIFKIITVHKYTRYPVYDPQEQDFIGIIHVKDLLAALYEKKELMDIKELIRPILKIPRRLPALDLLSKFREGGTHFALIYDRKNTLLGFITLDNLLHVIIGKIKDEFHLTREDWIENPDGSLTGKGNSSIYSLERVLQDFDVPADIDTITGLILHRLDRMPVVGERVEFSDFVAEIKKIEGAYITLVKIYPKKSTQETL